MSVENEFLNKNMTLEIYKQIAKNSNTNQNKQATINKLIQVMKVVFKDIDTTRVNDSNINSIKSQFMNICLEQLKDIKNEQQKSKLNLQRSVKMSPVDRFNQMTSTSNDKQSTMDNFEKLINERNFNKSSGKKTKFKWFKYE